MSNEHPTADENQRVVELSKLASLLLKALAAGDLDYVVKAFALAPTQNVAVGAALLMGVGAAHVAPELDDSERDALIAGLANAAGNIANGAADAYVAKLRDAAGAGSYHTNGGYI